MAPAPHLLICLHREGRTCGKVLRNGAICVNLLREHQTKIADIFAGRGASDAQRRRAADRWLPMAGGAPGCRIVQARFCGSHYVIFRAVGDVYVAGRDAAPIYANRHYGRMAAQAA